MCFQLLPKPWRRQEPARRGHGERRHRPGARLWPTGQTRHQQRRLQQAAGPSHPQTARCRCLRRAPHGRPASAGSWLDDQWLASKRTHPRRLSSHKGHPQTQAQKRQVKQHPQRAQSRRPLRQRGQGPHTGSHHGTCCRVACHPCQLKGDTGGCTSPATHSGAGCCTHGRAVRRAGQTQQRGAGDEGSVHEFR